MYKTVIMILVSIFLLAGCSVETSSAPDGVRKDYYKEAVELTKIIESRMTNAEPLTDKEDQKLNLFFAKYKTESSKEMDIYATLAKLEANYKVNVTFRDDAKTKNTSTKFYVEDLKKLKTLLDIKE